MMLMGASLMRTGWLKGEFSLRHYRRTGAGLVLLGVLINLPAVMRSGTFTGITAGARSCSRCRVN
jgi:uncharacterized membrane protein YeiB